MQFTGNQFTTYKNVVFDFSTASSGDILLAIINHADFATTPVVVPTGFSLLAGASNNYVVVYEKEADGTETATETFSYITSGGITSYGDIRSGPTYDYASMTSGKSSNTNSSPSIVLTPVNNDDFLLTGLGYTSVSATITTFDSDLSLLSNTSNILTKLRIGSGDGLTPSPSAHVLSESSSWEIFAVYLPLKTVTTTLVNTLSGSVSTVGYIPTATATTTPNPTLVSTGYGTLLATGSIPTITATTVPNPTTANPLLGAVAVTGYAPVISNKLQTAWGMLSPTNATAAPGGQNYFIGGTSDAVDGMVLESVTVTTAAAGVKFRLGLYTGGTLTDLTGAVLLEDLGEITNVIANSKLRAYSTTKPTIPKNTLVWLAVKTDGGLARINTGYVIDDIDKVLRYFDTGEMDPTVALPANPTQVGADISTQTWGLSINYSVEGVAVQADPLLGTATVTGYAPTVATPNPITVLAVQGTVTITGYDPSVISIDPITINPTPGAVLLTGLAPAVTASLNTIVITTGTVTPTVTETSLVAGNYTIILTLTNDTWIPL